MTKAHLQPPAPFHQDPFSLWQKGIYDNSLYWLAKHEPGGNEMFMRIFVNTNQRYLGDLEASGKADTVLWIGQPGTGES